MKQGTWDLSVYYQSIDDPALREDIAEIHTLVEKCSQYLESVGEIVPKLEGILRFLEKLFEKMNRAFGYCQLILATDTGNTQALHLMDEMSLMHVRVESLNSKVTRFVGGIAALEEAIQLSSLLREHAFLLSEYQQMAIHLLPEDMEEWMLRMSLSGGDAFSKLRDQLMGSHLVELDGKSLPLSTVRGMAYDSDAGVRKRAYHAELASYEKVALPMAFALGNIKGEAITMAEAKGYSDVLSQQLAESRMDEQTLQAMFAAIREALPSFQRYLRVKGRLLGYADGLPFYELFAPVAEEDKRYTIEETEELLVETFGNVHPPMGKMIRRAFDERWIDVYPCEGKEGGAFCAGNYQLRVSRILTNFMGSFSDVSTLAHELGHAWHNCCLQHAPALLADSPMPLAETASIFNETLLSHVVREAARPEERFALLEGHLMEVTQTIVDIYSRFLFESKVFQARKTHIPSVDELKTMMLDAQQEAYGDGLSKEERHPYMWICKPHYYSVGLHYYNFPYAFGLLFGMGVFAKYRREGAPFMSQYDTLLSACGSGLVKDVTQSVGIDVQSVTYWREALGTILSEIEEFVELAEKR